MYSFLLATRWPPTDSTGAGAWVGGSAADVRSGGRRALPSAPPSAAGVPAGGVQGMPSWGGGAAAGEHYHRLLAAATGHRPPGQPRGGATVNGEAANARPGRVCRGGGEGTGRSRGGKRAIAPADSAAASKERRGGVAGGDAARAGQGEARLTGQTDPQRGLVRIAKRWTDTWWAALPQNGWKLGVEKIHVILL